MKIRNMAIFGAIGVAALALIGAGAAATFNTTTTAQQQITAGNLSVSVNATGASCTGVDTSGNCNAIALPDYTATSSNFDSGPITVTETNQGTVTPYEISLGFGDTIGGAPASTALASQVYLCMTSDGSVLENGPLSTLTGYSFTRYALPNTGDTDYQTVEYYAGDAPTLCGGESSGGTTLTTPAPNPSALSLTNPAEGGVITPSFTLTYEG
jgi:hypothetical protein